MQEVLDYSIIEKLVAPSVSLINTTRSRVMPAISDKVNRYGQAVHSRLYICIVCDLSTRDSPTLTIAAAAEWLLLPSACRRLTSLPR